MSAALLSLHYLPNTEWFKNYLQHEHILIEKHENFVKSTGRNRCFIAAANGRQILTIPLSGGRDHHRKYIDVRIDYHTNWNNNHWHAIKSAYGSAPYFEFYGHIFQKFYEKQYQFLFDFNAELLQAVLAILKTDKGFEYTSGYEKEVSAAVDLRSLKGTPDIGSHQPRYIQVFEERHGFISNLSIIDLVFNLGPHATSYLYKG